MRPEMCQEKFESHPAHEGPDYRRVFAFGSVC